MKIEDIKQILQEGHYEILTKKDTPSQFINTSNYQIILIRSISVENSNLSLHVRRFLILNETILEFNLHNNSTKQIASYQLFFKELKEIIDYYDDVLEGYSDAVDEKEDSLYKHQITPLFLNNWFNLKRDLATIDRVLVRLEYFFSHLQQAYTNTPEIITLNEEVATSRRYATFQLSRLDTIYNYFYSLKNEKMNDQIFLLTLVSAIFLPINLIVGFFGMNTQNLFFSDAKEGTLYVVYLMLFVLLFIVVAFPLYRFVKRIVFMRLLKEFSIHKKIKNSLLDNDQES